MGDGVLAIFPAADDDDFSEASVQALEAALEGLERLGMVNKARRETDRPEFRIGIGLHLGEVIFGNVGAADRLDFTVIGPAVNLASRIEGLTKRLLRPILVSSAFARICPRPLVSLGFHPVRGLFEPEEVFGLPEEPQPMAAGSAQRVLRDGPRTGSAAVSTNTAQLSKSI